MVVTSSEIHITLLKLLGLSQIGLYNDLPGIKPKFDYNMIVIYLKLYY